jgi:hypothetical protein
MQDKLIDILRVQREHGGILEAIGNLLGILSRSGVGTTDEAREITGRLTELRSELSEHIHFEEQEVLAKLANYATEILTRGLIWEHEEILTSISELMGQARDLADGSSDETALGLFQAKLIETMQDIRQRVEDHAQKQECILELANNTLEREAG